MSKFRSLLYALTLGVGLLASSREAKAFYETNVVDRSSETNNANRIGNVNFPFKLQFDPDFLSQYGVSTNDEVALKVRPNPIYESNRWDLTSYTNFVNGLPDTNGLTTYSLTARPLTTNRQPMQAPYPQEVGLTYYSFNAGMEMPVITIGQSNSVNPNGYVPFDNLLSPSGCLAGTIIQPLWDLDDWDTPCTNHVPLDGIATAQVGNIIPEPAAGLVALLGIGAAARKKGWLAREYEAQQKNSKYQ